MNDERKVQFIATHQRKSRNVWFIFEVMHFLVDFFAQISGNMFGERKNQHPCTGLVPLEPGGTHCTPKNVA